MGFALRIKFQKENRIKVSDFQMKENKNAEFSHDLKEKIIVTEEGVIYDSIKRESNREFSEKTQRNLGKIINQLNEDQISEITSDLCLETIPEEKNELKG